jgi:transposase-like protein
MEKNTNPYSGHRYPDEIIIHAVWLCFRFTLSFRDIECGPLHENWTDLKSSFHGEGQGGQ